MKIASFTTSVRALFTMIATIAVFSVFAAYTLAAPAYAADNSSCENGTCTVSLPVEKRITGDAPSKDETFTFVLEGEKGTATPTDGTTATITGEGTASFELTDLGLEDYYYTIHERAGSTKGYTYDDAVYHVTVHVAYGESNVQEATVVMQKDGAKGKSESALFVNQYDDGKAPQTPDDLSNTGSATSIIFWTALACATAAGLIVLLVASRRNPADDLPDIEAF